MKKRLISALLTVCMVLTLCPAVRADSDPGYADGAPRNFVRIHWSGGEWIYEKGYGIIGALPSGVSFNAASSTLTLHNADLGPVDIYAWGSNKLTIVAEGVNTLSSLSISACHNVEIRGSGTINARPDAPAENGSYDTALSFFDVCVPEERDGESDRLYPYGNLVIDGVTMNLYNPETEIGWVVFNEYYAGYGAVRNGFSMGINGNVTLRNGAKIVENSLQGVGISGDLTIEAGASLTACRLSVSGYDEGNEIPDGGNTRRLTVNGTLTLTGTQFENVTGDVAHWKDVYANSLEINPNAVLVVNEGGIIDVTAPKFVPGAGISFSEPDYVHGIGAAPEETGRFYLRSGRAEINGGKVVMNVNSVDMAGVALSSGCEWVQNGGTLDISITPVGGTNAGGIILTDGVFTLNGGTVSVRTPDGCRGQNVSGVWMSRNTDDTVYNSSTFTVNGGELDISLSGAEGAYSPGIDISGENCRFELRRGTVDISVDSDTGLFVRDDGALVQAGGVLRAAAGGGEQGFAMKIFDASVALKGGSTVLTGVAGAQLNTTSDDGARASLSVDGGALSLTGVKGSAVELTEGSRLTVLSGEVTAETKDASAAAVFCAPDSRLDLLGGTVRLRSPSGGVLLDAPEAGTVLVGDGMTATDDATGKAIPIDAQFRRHIAGPAVTVSGGEAVGIYDCEMSVTSGEVTQGARFNLRADVSLGAEEGQISFTLPVGVSYVPGSLTVDGWSVLPDSTSPLTVTLQKGGTVRFSAVSERTGAQTLTANITGGKQAHRESLSFTVSAFNLSLPDATARLVLPVTGTTLPGSAITFYEDGRVLGSTSANALGTWSGTVTLPNVQGVHTVYAVIRPTSGGSFRSEEHEITYDPALNEVKTLTVTNMIHGRTDADEPVEEKLVIDYINGRDNADYYTYWPELPTFTFRADFVEDASALGSVTVVTTDRSGAETRVPLRYHQADGAWIGSYDYDEKITPRKFRVEYAYGEKTGSSALSGEYTMDKRGNIVKAVYDDGSVYTYTYDANDRPVKAVSGDLTFYYDELGRVERTVDGRGDGFTVSYNDDGSISRLTFTDDTFIEYSRDSAGGLISATDGEVTGFYNEQMQLERISGKDGTARLTYDASGALKRITYPDGTYTEYTYDAQGQVTGVSDGATSFSLRYEGDKAFMTGPDGTELSWSPAGIPAYDAGKSSDRASLGFKYPDGSSVVYEMEGDQFFMHITLPGGKKASSAYDKDGRLTSITEGGRTTALAYNGKSGPVKITYPDGRTVSYQYDSEDRIVLVTDSEGYKTGYTYNEDGCITSVTDGSKVLVTYRYDPDGALTRVDNANGAYTLYTYDGEQIASIENHGADGGLLSSFAYTYDSEGRVVSMTDADGKWTYSYDGQGQLIRAEAPDGTVTTYAYDAAGNRTRVTRDGEAVPYTANSENQYTAFGDTRRTYDADGNLLTETRDGKTARYTWDELGLLTGFTDFDGTVYEYGYDAFGLRDRVTVNGETTLFVNDPLGIGLPVASYGSSGELHYSSSGALAAVRSGDDVYYYNTNMIGSVTEITGPDGSAVNRYTYDQEGNVVSRREGIYNPFTYAGIFGLVADGNGLIYDRARYISAETDSFISPDPAGTEYDENLYRYVGNDFVNYIDITGEVGISAGGIVGKTMTQFAKKEIPAKAPIVEKEATQWLAEHGLVPVTAKAVDKAGTKINIVVGVCIPVLVVSLVPLFFSPPAEAAELPETPPPEPPVVEDPDDEDIDPEDMPPWQRALDNPVFVLYSNLPFPAWVTPVIYIAAYIPEKWPNNPITKAAGWLGTKIGQILYPEPTQEDIDRMVPDPRKPLPPEKPKRGLGPFLNPKLLVWVGKPSYTLTDPHRTPDRSKKMIEDPSGYVYEGIPSNRLEGVTTTIYFSAAETKPTGNASESQRWNAAEFGQVNPLSTDASGQYMWMVPDGWWQVKYEKAGFDAVWSDWLPVPPVQTEVNVSMTSSAPAALALSGDADSGSVILRFSRPVRLDSVNSGTVRLTRNGAALSGELIPVDAGIADDNQVCATVFELTPEGQPVRSGDVLTASFSGVVTYAGTASSGSASATGAREMPFDDVRASDYFYDPVLWASRHTPQIAAGTSATAFSPNDSCTRAQAVTLLWRAMGQPEPTTNVCPFRDVTPGAYYYKAVLWAAEKGIATGTAVDVFSPDAACSRAQIVTFLHRAEGTPRSTESASKFKDVDSSAYYYSAVLWAAQWGIATGTSDDAFSPDQVCTRGQIVTFLYRDMK